MASHCDKVDLINNLFILMEIFVTIKLIFFQSLLFMAHLFQCMRIVEHFSTKILRAH